MLHHRDLMVVTNNMNVANILAANPDCQIILTGGTLPQARWRADRNLTVASIRQFKFDIAVIGCSAMDDDGDMLDFDIQEVGVSQTIIAQSRKTFLVADHSKFERNAPARIASLAEIDSFFTDVPLSNRLTSLCREWNTEVIVASEQVS